MTTTPRAAMGGIAATAAALGVSELLAGLLSGAGSLVAGIDKLALEIIIVLVALAIGAGLGILARREMGLAQMGFALFGVVGFLTTLRDPLASAPITAVSAAISVAIGIWVLGWLVGPRRAETPRRVVGPTGERTMPDWSRRSFLVRAGGVAVPLHVMQDGPLAHFHDPHGDGRSFGAEPEESVGGGPAVVP